VIVDGIHRALKPAALCCFPQNCLQWARKVASCAPGFICHHLQAWMVADKVDKNISKSEWMACIWKGRHLMVPSQSKRGWCPKRSTSSGSRYYNRFLCFYPSEHVICGYSLFFWND
jgi:hypothetical protein